MAILIFTLAFVVIFLLILVFFLNKKVRDLQNSQLLIAETSLKFYTDINREIRNYVSSDSNVHIKLSELSKMLYTTIIELSERVNNLENLGKSLDELKPIDELGSSALGDIIE